MAGSGKGKVKVESIDQIGIVVEDCEKVAKRWEEMLGIGPWRTMTNTGTDAEGNPVEVKLAFAYVGDLEFELIEVVKGRMAHSEWLEEHGEGLQHLSFFSDDPDGDTTTLVEKGARVVFQRPGQLSLLDLGPGGVIWEPQRRRGKIPIE